jgi:Cdc6-like AAA superfamily ATPase
MKYQESTFQEYIQSNNNYNLHPKYKNLIKKIPNNLKDLNNIIIYGPSGIGKYTQSLSIISKYSNNDLHYEKKIKINFQNKHIYIVKISDIHFEVDFELLGCNAKMLWSDVFNQIIDIINGKMKKEGIILCKNFHTIHSELLEIFYNYMQDDYNNNSITLKYIILTEHISFLPKNITDMCSIISYNRPTYLNYKKCLAFENNYDKDIFTKGYELSKINNIKNLKNNIQTFDNKNTKFCDTIIEMIMNYKNMNFILLREELYNILIYQLNVYDCMYDIIKGLCKTISFSQQQLFKINNKLIYILKYYNNNYRPITHLETFVLYLCSILIENEY